MPMGKTGLTHCLLLLLLASCTAGPGGDAQAEEGRTVDSRNSVPVSRYCDNFARKYAENNAMEYQEDSTSIEKQSDVLMHLSNMFQPSDSKFTAGYACHFQARNKQGHVHDISVAIFLTGTLQFAEYTKWRDLQIIPIAYAVDETNDRAGYGVFKYLENH